MLPNNAYEVKVVRLLVLLSVNHGNLRNFKRKKCIIFNKKKAFTSY